MILSVQSILSFWRWSDSTPCLYATVDLDRSISLVNRPHIICQKELNQKEEVVLITMPQSSIFLTVENTFEKVNIDGEVVERETITYTNCELIPDEEEIGTLRDGWQFGSSKFISSTQVLTYFSKGIGAILISELQRNCFLRTRPMHISFVPYIGVYTISIIKKL